MAEKRAKHEVQQMLRYLKDGTPMMSPRTSPRSPDLSRSDKLLREKYDELNRLMLSQIAQRKTLGHLYSSYDLEFKKARPESCKSTRQEKQKQTLKTSAKRLTEIIDRDRGIRSKVWEMPSDSEEEIENESNDEDEVGNVYTDGINECDSTVNSTVTIHEVNSDGDEIQSDDEKVTTGTTSAKRVSFGDSKQFKSDPIPSYDVNSLEALILKDILRNERKTPKYTDSGLSQAKSVKRFKYKCKKGTPRQKKSVKTDTSPTERSPRQKIKSALDNHLDSSSVDVKQWIREKNKIARKKLKEGRKKERIEMEKEQNEANQKAIRLVESEEKVTQWMKDKQKQALIQRKLRQRVEEIQRRNAAMKKTDESKQNNQIKEQFEIRKSTIRRRQRRINKHKAEIEDAVVTKKAEGNVHNSVDPATARLVHDEKLQARAAKKKYGISVRETLKSAARQLNKENNTELEDTNNCYSNESKLRPPNGNSNKTAGKKQTKKGRKTSSDRTRENDYNETENVGPTVQGRKTNRMTYNAWIKIKREGESNKELENESMKKVDPDLEHLLPTLSKQRIKRATESKKVTDTGSLKTQTTTKRPTRPSSGKLSYERVFDSSNETLRRPTSAMNRRDAGKLPQNVATKSDVSRQSWKNDKSSVLLEGERPEPQGCELPDYSFCQKVTDDVTVKKRPISRENEIDVLNRDGIFITA